MRYIKLLQLELKSLLAEKVRLAAYLLAGLAMLLALPAAAALLERAGVIFERFEVGLVTDDTSAELAIIMDFFGQEVAPLTLLPEEEARHRLADGRLSAYIELPENFAADILSGVNTPFYVHVSAAAPLQGQLAAILSTAGIAYLSAAQAGIYATIDEAHAQNLPAAEAILPANVAFAMTLLEYEERFAREILPLLGDTTPEEFLAKRFAIFWYMLVLVWLAKFLRRAPGLVARFKLAGLGARMDAIRLAAFFIVQFCLTLPLLYFWNIGTVAGIAALLTAFAWLAANLFREDSACGLFIFFVAFGTWFLSGGIVPPAFLPMDFLVNFPVNPPAWLF